MAALVGNPTSVLNPLDWTLLFARQPEPDLEFTEEELDQTITTKARGPMNPRKKSSGGGPTLWILLLALVSGIAYVATMEPETLTEWLSPYLGESTPPPMAMKPKPLTPAPVAPSAPAPQAAPSPSNETSAPLAPATAPATAVAPVASAVVPAQTAARPTAPVAPPLDPMFSEGQKVTITMDETVPGGSISLFADSSRSKLGPIVRPGVSLTVLDGDLQPGGWMYMVHTDEGSKGWVSEKRLRLKF
jgi:hypothetical protein